MAREYIENDIIGVDVFSSDAGGSVTNVALLGMEGCWCSGAAGAVIHFAWSNVLVGSHTLKAGRN
jgi:hypothetical protein